MRDYSLCQKIWHVFKNSFGEQKETQSVLWKKLTCVACFWTQGEISKNKNLTEGLQEYDPGGRRTLNSLQLRLL